MMSGTSMGRVIAAATIYGIANAREDEMFYVLLYVAAGEG